MNNSYLNRNQAFKYFNEHIKEGGILFLGDSIIDCYNVYEFFYGLDVYNRGISGDTTQDILKRLEESVYQLKPRKVFLLIGTNDLELLDAPIEDVIKGIKEIVKQIQTNVPAATIYLLSIYPVHYEIKPFSVGKRKNADIIAINNEIKKISGVTYLDIHSKLVDENGKLDKKYTYDGIHISNYGYHYLTNILKVYVV